MEEYLMHHGIKGQKWGIRRYQNEDGSYTDLGLKRRSKYSHKDNIFISGKVKYDHKIESSLKDEIDAIVKSGAKIHIGDAPGADTRVQEYLAEKKYKNVIVYTTDLLARNNIGNWPVNNISSDGLSDEREIRRQKDIAMTNASNKGLAISLIDDRPDSATSLNIDRLIKANKKVKLYDYKTGKYYYL